MRHEVVDAKLAHLHALQRTLRAQDRALMAEARVKPRHVMFELWCNSPLRRAFLIDGIVAAVGGVVGSMLGPMGIVWLVTGAALERNPFAVVRAARDELRAMLVRYPVLTSEVAADDARAVKFARRLGFAFGEAHPMPPSEARFYPVWIER